MRILFLYSGLAVGGAERQLSLLVPRLRERGFDPLVATLRVRGRYFDELQRAGVPVMHVGMRTRWDVRGMMRAIRLSSTRPDIVMTQSIDAQLIGHAIARRAGAVHVAVEQGGPGLDRHRPSHHRLAGRLLAPRVDAVVAVTAAQRPDLKRIGYPDDAVRVIPNAVPELHPARSAREVRSELGLDQEDFVVILVAALRSEKRADRFVDAAAIAHRHNSSVKGLVAGGGPLMSQVRSQAASLGAGVRILGERQDIPDLVAASDVLCLSSDVEGIPLAALEAMSLGKPVVATDVGGMRDLVVDGETGILVTPADSVPLAEKLLELAEDRPRAQTMGAAGYRRYSELYRVDAMVEAYVALFHDITSGRQ